MLNKFIINLGILTIFIAGTIYTTDEFRILHMPLLFVGFSLLIISILIKIKSNIKFDKNLFLLFLLEGILMGSAALVNSDVFLLVGMIGLVGSQIVLCYICTTYYNNYDNYIKMINKLVFIVGVVVVVFSILVNPIGTKSYSGIFYSSNAFGNTIAAFSSVCIASMFVNLSNKKNVTKQLVILLLLFYLILMSGSRTSIIAMLITLIIPSLILLLRKELNIVQIFKMLSKYLVALIVVLLIISRVEIINNAFQTRIIDKFIKKSENQLDGRGEVWIETLKSASLFGNGRDHFATLGLGHGAHNTFISLLGQYGWATLIIFSAFILYVLFKSIKSIILNQSYLQYYTLTTGLSFIFLSLGEAMLMKFSMFLFFITIGSLENNVKKEKNLLYN